MTLALKIGVECKNPLETITDLVSVPMAQVDQVIKDHLRSDIDLIEELAKHLIFAGGKRIRPLLTLASAGLFDGQNKAVALAAAIEFIHTATLLHDDVVDDSDLRRGLTAAHKIWGNSASILVGDFLFARAFELMVKTERLDVLDILSKASAAIAAGEVLQLTHAHSLDLDLDTSLKIIEAKTAQLFAAACQTGALVAGASAIESDLMRQYGTYLGLIFQIIDDILDYTSANTARGKVAGDDFREGKITLPVIFAYQAALADERRFFERTMVKGEQNPDDLNIAISLINKYQGFEQAYHQAEIVSHKALTAIDQLSSRNQFQHTLKALVEFCLHRGV